MLNIEKIAPSVVDASPFDPIQDVHDLRKAIKGLGTNESVLINIICNRSNAQRQVLREKYNTEFDRDLLADIKADTSGNFRKVLLSLLETSIDFYTTELHDALSKKSPDAFVELLGSMKPSNLKNIKSYYETMYSSKLSEDISKAFPNDFLFFGVGLFNDDRKDGSETNIEEAKKSVQKIYDNLEKKIGTEGAALASVLTNSNLQQLELITKEYKAKFDKNLEQDIENYVTGVIKETFLAMLQLAKNVAEFYANRLKLSMKGLGTRDDQLIRIIVQRSEIDMNHIENAFFIANNKSLVEWVKADTSGDYRKSLEALLSDH